MSRPVTLYALFDESGTMRYVGQTRQPAQRRRAHAKAWPELTMVVLEQTDEDNADERERELIAYYQGVAGPLLNIMGTAEAGRRRAVSMRRVWAQRKASPPLAASMVAVQMRLPADLYELVKRVAEREERSVHGQVVWCVKQCASIQAEAEHAAHRAAYPNT